MANQICPTCGSTEFHGAQWISVEDSLPQFEHEVLTTDGTGYANVAERYKVTRAGEHWRRCAYDGEGDGDVRVTHWMELPPLPKREP